MVKGLIFDYGGTLDTGGTHWGKVLWHAYERCGVPVSEGMFREAYVYAERTLATRRIITPEFTFRDTLDRKIGLEMDFIRENHGLENVEEFHAKVVDSAYGVAQQCTEKAAGVLRRLGERYPMVLVSNFYGNIEKVLQEFALDGIFGSVVESAMVGIRKPDPRIFSLGVERLGLKPEETMVVGDSYDKDIVPAHSIGCRTAWIKGEGWTDETVENPMADRIIESLDELPD